jgi:hypothetical protein
MSIEDKILQKIKEEKLRPTSLWYFLLRDYSLWGLVFLSIILASLSVAPILFTLSNIELGYLKHISDNIFFFILSIIPYPWIILCIFTTYFASLAWKRTKGGYKFKGGFVLSVSVLLSLLLGIVLNIFHLGKILDEGVEARGYGFYKGVESRKQENWFSPQNGRLIGRVKEIQLKEFVIINKKNNFEGSVSYDETVPGFENVVVDNPIRVIGYKADDVGFTACAIFPDNFSPTITPGTSTKEKKEMLEARVSDHPECKEMLSKGRALFKPKPKI